MSGRRGRPSSASPGELLPVRGPPPSRWLEPSDVCLARARGLVVDASAIPRGKRGDREPHVPVLTACADHEDDAGLVAGADEDVLRSGRRVEEITGAEASLLALDQQRALAREHEEVLL